MESNKIIIYDTHFESTCKMAEYMCMHGCIPYFGLCLDGNKLILFVMCCGVCNVRCSCG